MSDLEDIGNGLMGCVGVIFILVLHVALWLLPIALGIWILQAAGCV